MRTRSRGLAIARRAQRRLRRFFGRERAGGADSLVSRLRLERAEKRNGEEPEGHLDLADTLARLNDLDVGHVLGQRSPLAGLGPQRDLKARRQREGEAREVYTQSIPDQPMRLAARGEVL